MKFPLPILLLLLSAPSLMRGQDPSLAFDDLKYSRGAFAANHLLAQVSLQMGGGKFLRYRYDRYAEVKRITAEDGATYVQPKGQGWLKSSDWGKTGTAVKGDQVGVLDMQATVAEAPFAESDSHDASQGGTLWKFIQKTEDGDMQSFTYEKSREKPHLDGVYPRYTFLKYKNDPDGKLLLSRFTGQMRSGKEAFPVEIKLGLMLLLPGNTVIEEGPAQKKTK